MDNGTMKEEREHRNILVTKDLAIGYKQSKKDTLCLLSDINLTIRKGEMVCLLGPNGAGKSTLMRTIAGIQSPLDGCTLVEGIPIRDRNFKEIAQLLSIVLTERINVGNLTVYHIVSLGRHPYTSWMGKLSDADNDKIKWALEQVGLLHYANHYINQLSDGERQRVMIAKALAQDTPLIMLDEPTAHLDLPNRVEIMRLLHRLARETNKAILMSTHELDLALQAADLIWLMARNQPVKVGAPEDLVLNGSIEDTFQNKSFNFDRKTGNFIMNYQKKQTIQLLGNDVMGFWTQRALSREGYQVTCEQVGDCCVKLMEETMKWEIHQNGSVTCCNSIQELIASLKETLHTN
ncbi:ABC transporter ATP-binding protein [Marinifilum flexuosum]|uniref:ABC transporter ATP-binding protein n=1 Tax=Marinifilum flexuosum TaxID=1117708 RepID=UPI00249406B9|nr:ABC transporter ATP-binding protein [Marinifilum flexuosum]